MGTSVDGEDGRSPLALSEDTSSSFADAATRAGRRRDDDDDDDDDDGDRDATASRRRGATRVADDARTLGRGRAAASIAASVRRASFSDEDSHSSGQALALGGAGVL